MQIVNDDSCNACIDGVVVVATFERNGPPAVTSELVIDQVDVPNAFTTLERSAARRM